MYETYTIIKSVLSKTPLSPVLHRIPWVQGIVHILLLCQSTSIQTDVRLPPCSQHSLDLSMGMFVHVPNQCLKAWKRLFHYWTGVSVVFCFVFYMVTDTSPLPLYNTYTIDAWSACQFFKSISTSNITGKLCRTSLFRSSGSQKAMFTTSIFCPFGKYIKLFKG